jgi:hypothetical protein
MPIEEYHGKTFVAFVDISGFKSMMKDPKKAFKALDRFYQIGYDVLFEQENNLEEKRIDGLFISDCGVLFSRLKHNENIDDREIKESLNYLLKAIEKISKRMIQADFLLTASVAYGQFDYQERIEFSGIDKNLMFGNAYLDAYLDNENGKPKLEPGHCRILIKDLNDEFWNSIQCSNDPPFNRLISKPSSPKHLYFYWMVDNENKIDDFQKNYRDTYNLKYRGMISVIKRSSQFNDDCR